MKIKKLHWNQKLKADNLLLQQQLRELATNPDSMNSQEIITWVKFGDSHEKSLWFGIKTETPVSLAATGFEILEQNLTNKLPKWKKFVLNLFKLPIPELLYNYKLRVKVNKHDYFKLSDIVAYGGHRFFCISKGLDPVIYLDSVIPIPGEFEPETSEIIHICSTFSE